MSVKRIDTAKDRLPIYQEVLAFLESGEKMHPKWHASDCTGLCILLPCAWGDIKWLDYFMDSKGEKYEYWETVNYFPEFREYYDRGCNRHCHIYLTNPVMWRIKVLKEIIEKINA